MSEPTVSIIVRTRNEESWIAHCLTMVFGQRAPEFEVIIVDNESTDHTVPLARRFPVREIVTVRDYRPGRALNQGIARARGRFIACLSAHCIPINEHWLQRLLSGFDDPAVAGVYGRQLPLPFTTAVDRRDLLTVFGRDRRVQEKDWFFHNANSVVRRDVLDALPFDESLPHLEDRDWAKRAIEAGYRLVYEPEAAVYHYHGLHHDNDDARAKGVSATLDLIAEDIVRELPETLRPENSTVAAVVPVLGPLRTIPGPDLLGDLLRELKAARYVRRVYALSENEAVRGIAEREGVAFIPRPDALLASDVTLADVLRFALERIEAEGVYPEAILFANYLFPFRPPALFDELIVEARYKGLDTVFPGFVDYNDHWVAAVDGAIRRVTEALKPGADRPQVYRSLYGLGCVTHSATIRRGRLVGDKVGILPIGDHIYTLRCTDRKREEPSRLATEPRAPHEHLVEAFLRDFRP